MREFVYFSGQARTSGNWKDLMKAGRMDIVCHVIIQAFFLSHKIRQDTKLHLVFYGPPDPPKHIEMFPIPKEAIPGTGKEVGSIDISKKDVSGLIKRILFKYKQDKKTEVFPGYFIEKKSLLRVIEELRNEGKEIYVLDDRGKDIREIEFEQGKEPVFVLGDHHGLPQKELKRLKKEATLVSIGKEVYFASQVVAIVNNELDRRGV